MFVRDVQHVLNLPPLQRTQASSILLAELQALEFEEDRVEYEEVEQTTPDGIAMMAQWRALKAACDALSPVGRYKVASVSYRKCAFQSITWDAHWHRTLCNLKAFHQSQDSPWLLTT